MGVLPWARCLVRCLFSELTRTPVVGYRTAGNDDMFHDIYPMRDLAHTPSQKTVDTIKFHADIPNNRLRPDWVYLLSVRNDPVDDVYTVFIRLQDVFARLGDDVIEKLERPLFFSPKDTLGILVLAFGDFDLSSVGRM